jgi:pseudouridine-5'-phosphate glycosidase
MLKRSKDVAEALRTGKPLVALESTIICHGMPSPANGMLAKDMEAAVRRSGSVPATIAIIEGAIHIGLEPDEIAGLTALHDVRKCATRDLPAVIAQGANGATTVSATVFLAAGQGIRVMATGGLGGVHRGGAVSMDVSSDLTELARSPVAVISSGVKSILDQARTMEKLETLGVPVVGFGCDRLPAFYTAESAIAIPRIDDIEAAARLIKCHGQLGLPGGLMIANPPPEAYAMTGHEIEVLATGAQRAAEDQGMTGPAQTPFMLRHMAEATGGRTVELNYHLAVANATLAGEIAAQLALR